jgi:peptidoglycan/LPS O-acetylase OafA/YrhL
VVRLKRLDVLRAIAVFIVLGRHVYVTKLWMRAGWMGVDLFFVLSGFLVTGLLLNEQRNDGRMRAARFWLRRGFKIYPSFYALLLLAVVTGFHQEGHFLPEALFYQNYVHGWWHHTWSLAVEEHFYFLLPVVLVILERTARGRTDPFHRLPWVVFGVAVTSLVLRILTARYAAPTTGSEFNFRHVTPTHLRLDSLAFGALLSYLHHCRGLRFTRPQMIGLLVVSTLLIAPCTMVDVNDSVALATWGLTAVYLGFGGLLMVCLQWPKLALPRAVTLLVDALAWVGRYSYSIYLWHMPIKLETEALFARYAPHTRDQIVFVVFAAISIAVGVTFSKIIEVPALKLRDRLLPPDEKPVPIRAAA